MLLKCFQELKKRGLFSTVNKEQRKIFPQTFRSYGIYVYLKLCNKIETILGKGALAIFQASHITWYSPKATPGSRK